MTIHVHAVAAGCCRSPLPPVRFVDVGAGGGYAQRAFNDLAGQVGSQLPPCPAQWATCCLPSFPK